jgi:crotonobetainyl-CoA:carnitine CoA-transferase CaiB-like acyl-CoA transferase
VPFAPVITVEQAVDLPQVKFRRSVRTIHDEQIGEFKVPASPLRFSGFPDQPPLSAPFLGQHNSEVLQKMLDYDPQQIAALSEKGVLCERRPGN